MDTVYFIDSNGVEYTLHDDTDKMVTALTGVGLPDIDHFTQKTPFQHGAQFLGYQFKPRKVAVGIYRYPDNRDLLYQDHNTLLNALNPYNGVGKLKWVLNDGSVRCLDVYVSGGMKFDTDKQVAFKHQVDVIELTAYNPFWYNPVVNTTTAVMNETNTPMLPITLPFMLSGSGITVTSTVVNNGHTETNPVITIYGPGIDPIIYNVTTNKTLSLTYTLTTLTESITIDCRSGKKTVIYSNGLAATNVIGYLSSASEFFTLVPGNNTISFGMSDTTDDSQIKVQFYDEYLGV